MDGNLATMTYPNGRTESYTVNAIGQVVAVEATLGGNQVTLAESATYYPFGPLSAFETGDLLTTSRTFDTDYQLTDLTIGTLMDRHYEYDRNGNIQSITDFPTPASLPSFGTVNYVYGNSNNQLTGITNGVTKTYGYDDAGNLISEATDELALTYNYLQRLIEVIQDSTTLADYTYDALVS